jgi:hypothetical protein
MKKTTKTKKKAEAHIDFFVSIECNGFGYYNIPFKDFKITEKVNLVKLRFDKELVMIPLNNIIRIKVK